MNQEDAYRRFCKRHGGEENAVQIERRLIFPDGAEAVNEGVGVLMIDHEPNKFAGPSGRLHAARSKAQNVILHRQTLYEIAVDEFNELKRSLKGSCDRKGLKRLAALKEDVDAARKEVRRAERAAEKLEPGYMSKAERRRMDEIEAEEEERVAEYDASLNAIRL